MLVSCLSNEKQIGLALVQYAQDNDDRLPMGTQPSPGLGWVGQTYPYAKNTGGFHCAEDDPHAGSATLCPLSYA